MKPRMIDTGSFVGTCDVHALVEGDTSDKSVTYCEICDAWMCEPCKDNLPKRALAWAKRLENKLSGIAGS